jgi:hypothetical protein
MADTLNAIPTETTRYDQARRAYVVSVLAQCAKLGGKLEPDVQDALRMKRASVLVDVIWIVPPRRSHATVGTPDEYGWGMGSHAVTPDASVIAPPRHACTFATGLRTRRSSPISSPHPKCHYRQKSPLSSTGGAGNLPPLGAVSVADAVALHPRKSRFFRRLVRAVPCIAC